VEIQTPLDRKLWQFESTSTEQGRQLSQEATSFHRIALVYKLSQTYQWRAAKLEAAAAVVKAPSLHRQSSSCRLL